jgi:hypothetical protein
MTWVISPCLVSMDFLKIIKENSSRDNVIWIKVRRLNGFNQVFKRNLVLKLPNLVGRQLIENDSIFSFDISVLYCRCVDVVSCRNWARSDSRFGHQGALCENPKSAITPLIMVRLSLNVYGRLWCTIYCAIFLIWLIFLSYHCRGCFVKNT